MGNTSESDKLKEYLKRRFLGELVVSKVRGYHQVAVLSSSAIALSFSMWLAVIKETKLSPLQLKALKFCLVCLLIAIIVPAISLLISRIKRPGIDAKESIDVMLAKVDEAFPYRNLLLIISVVAELAGLLVLGITGLMS